LAYEIDSNQLSAGGATLAVFNNGPEHIASYRVDVSEINSWSETHGTFLPPYRFSRKAVIAGQNLDAMHKTSGHWLIRVVEKDGKRYLTVFNDDSTRSDKRCSAIPGKSPVRC
jgi:hypothetical protein